jgi:hypothetical protein
MLPWQKSMLSLPLVLKSWSDPIPSFSVSSVTGTNALTVGEEKRISNSKNRAPVKLIHPA